MKSYKLTPEGQPKERNTIQRILANNNYEASTLSKISKEKKQKRDTQKKKMRKIYIYWEGNEIYYQTFQQY